MALLSDDTLAQMRRQAGESLDQSCTLITPGELTDDGAGGQIEGAPIVETVACRIAPPTANETLIADRLSQLVDAAVTLPYGANVGATQRIGGPDGEEYQVVQSTTIPGQSWRTATRLLVRRIR